MPFRNVWAVRVRNPDDFTDGTFRTRRISNGVSILVGRLKTAPIGRVVQGYRFNTSRFKTRNQVINWLTVNKVKYIGIERPMNEQHAAVEKFRQVLSEVAERRT